MLGHEQMKKDADNLEEPSLAERVEEADALTLAEGTSGRKRSLAPKADSLAKLLVQALHRLLMSSK